MTDSTEADLLWWFIPSVLAGMSIPFVDPDRRLGVSAGLDEFQDDLPRLYEAGIRSVVCLLNIPSDERVYNAAGFEFLCSPIADYSPPTRDQALRICSFIDKSPKSVAVHCEGGIGRTGTVLAAYCIVHGDSADAAIQRVREVEPSAIETASQTRFLEQLAEWKSQQSR